MKKIWLEQEVGAGVHCLLPAWCSQFCKQVAGGFCGCITPASSPWQASGAQALHGILVEGSMRGQRTSTEGSRLSGMLTGPQQAWLSLGQKYAASAHHAVPIHSVGRASAGFASGLRWLWQNQILILHADKRRAAAAHALTLVDSHTTIDGYAAGYQRLLSKHRPDADWRGVAPAHHELPHRPGFRCQLSPYPGSAPPTTLSHHQLG